MSYRRALDAVGGFGWLAIGFALWSQFYVRWLNNGSPFQTNLVCLAYLCAGWEIAGRVWKPEGRFGRVAGVCFLGAVLTLLWQGEASNLEYLCFWSACGCAMLEVAERKGAPEIPRWMKSIPAQVPPPARFRSVATIALILSIGFSYGGPPYLTAYFGDDFVILTQSAFWTNVALACVFMGLIRWVAAKFVPGLPEDPIETGRSSLLLNVFSFLLPPVGLVSWLWLDGKNRRMARSAGRSAIRGATLILAAGNVLLLNFLVSTAVFAIHGAELHPMDDSRLRIMERQRVERRIVARKHEVGRPQA